MIKHHASRLIIALLLVSSFLVIPQSVSADMAGWDYRIPITVTNKIEGYQTLINISYSSGGDVTCGNNCETDFSDLRFTDSGLNEIPYWIEYAVDSSYAHVWVNNSANDSTLYMYYGNTDASTTSSINDTWDYADLWTYDNTADLTYSSQDGDRWRLRYTDSPFSQNMKLYLNYNGFYMEADNYAGGVGWLFSETTTPGDSANDYINLYFCPDIDTGGAADSTHTALRNVIKESGTVSNVWMPVPYTQEYEKMYTVITPSKVNVSLYEDNGDALICTSEHTTNIIDDINYFHYTTYCQDPAGDHAWTWESGEEAIYAGGWRFSQTRGCQKMYTKWVVIGKYVEPEPSFAFGAEESLGNVPEIEVWSPVDGATDMPVNTCVIKVNITHPTGAQFNYSWACSDGSYNMATGNTNGTKYLMLCMNGLLDCGTTYTWWVNASVRNDPANYTNESFSFTTVDCEGAYSNVHPENASSNICPCADCNNFTCICLDAYHESGNNVNISFYSNHSGAWVAIENYTNVSGRSCAFFQVEHDHQYWWYANISEYGEQSNYNQTEVFTFVTGSEDACASIHGFSSVEFSAFILMDIFILFMFLGYLSKKPSGGAFMLLSGFTLITLSIQIDMLYASALIVPIALFIMVLGIRKWFFPLEHEKRLTEGE